MLAELPPLNQAPIVEATAKQALKDQLTPRILETVRTIVQTGRDVLVVGHTDGFGPKQLNRSLGLQYAVIAANRLARELKIDLSRFHCVSRGEDPTAGEPGIAIYAVGAAQYQPAAAGKALMLLSPATGRELAPNLWTLWEADASNAYWGVEDSTGAFLWKLPTTVPTLNVPYPAQAEKMAVGVEYPEGPALAEWTGRERKPDPLLTLNLESLEQGHAHLMGKAPPGVRKLHVWAGGIPYPVSVGGSRFYATVVRFGQDTKAYAQGVDAKGRVIFGPPLALPPNAEGDPAMIAVLTWEGEEAEVDFSGWRGSSHTSVTDPDPAISRVAAPGVKLLFAGGASERATALWIDDVASLELEARLSGEGSAKAIAYVLTDPGDPVLRRGMILGPRILTNEPRAQRWVVLNLRDAK